MPHAAEFAFCALNQVHILKSASVAKFSGSAILGLQVSLPAWMPTVIHAAMLFFRSVGNSEKEDETRP